MSRTIFPGGVGARRKIAASIPGWDVANNAAAIFQERDFQLWVATDDYDDGTENWQMGEWSVYDDTFSEVASGHENSVNSAVWAVLIAAEEHGFDTGSVPTPDSTNASRSARHKQAGSDGRKQADTDYMYRDLAYKFYDWLADMGFSGEELASDDFDWEEVDRMVPQFAQENGVTVEDVSEATAQYAPGGPGFFAKVGSSQKQAGDYDYLDPDFQQRLDEMAPDGNGQAYWESLSFSEQVDAEDQFEYDQETSDFYSSKRKQANDYGPENYPSAKAVFEAFLADKGLGADAEGPYFQEFESKHGDGWSDEDLDFDLSTVGRRKSTKESNMPNRRIRQADQSRQDQGEKEETFISETPPAEPAVDPAEGPDAPNNTPEQRVQREDPDDNQLASSIKQMKLQIARMERQLKAKAIGEMRSNEGGGHVTREDLYESFDETQPKDASRSYQDRRRRDFIAWVNKTHGKKLSEARSASELRSWARTYAKAANINVSELHPVVSAVIEAKTKRASNEDDKPMARRRPRRKGSASTTHAPKRRTVSRQKKADTRKKAYGPADYSEEELFEEWLMAEYDRRPEDVSPEDRDLFYNEFLDGGGVVDWEKLYAKRAAQAAKRKKADTPADDLDVAAPDDRVNVDRPTENTTDDEAQSSQFDKSDFGNNAGDDIADVDKSLDHQWLPGEGKQSSHTPPKGHETVRLAEAYVAAGLATKEERWKLSADFEKMDRSVVLDRTALLERVATVHASREAKKTAGTHGASLKSAVPPNVGSGSSVQKREANSDSADTDSDIFL